MFCLQFVFFFSLWQSTYIFSIKKFPVIKGIIDSVPITDLRALIKFLEDRKNFRKLFCCMKTIFLVCKKRNRSIKLKSFCKSNGDICLDNYVYVNIIHLLFFHNFYFVGFIV